jgi:hypothetical protein
MFQIDLITLDYLRLHRGLVAAEDDDDDLLRVFIGEASQEFCEATQRTPHPYVATKSFGPERLQGGLRLQLGDDLLAVSSITNGDDAAISSGYHTAPDNVYPKSAVLLNSSGATTWSFTDNDDRVLIAALWGYVPHYGQQWANLTTLNGAMDATVTTLAIADATLLETGMYVLVGTEQMYVDDAATRRVVRGANGTTAASHISSDVVQKFVQLRDIASAVRDLAAYKYLTKDQIGSQVQVYDGGTVQVQSLSPMYAKTVERHKRRQAILGV